MYLFKHAQNVSFVMLYRRTMQFYRQVTKLGLVSNGNCTILPVDLCCMKFRHRLKILKKAKQRRCTTGPPLFVSKHKLFCYGFIKTHGTFGCDLQNRFEENAKEMRYCGAKLNVISDVLRHGEGRVRKIITNC